MKGLVTVTKVNPAKKNPEGVQMYSYFFTDSEGYKGMAFATDKPVKDSQRLVSMRSYKGKWYAKDLGTEVTD